ncbi:Sigma-fimbriae tip adhesin [Candidatus Burkholderia verschuerenii]|uniref:Sigma-fimbriae tip adhesin n=1 Tax=Candidatus Burkholderia verschuerenii TaxID=242163 RepID=A0A0L0M6A8_9BURK|nr:spore coat protein U domain-containing protein [Candidatus Burkholderia verschuerenii]KND57825.1 Sigma-fimbriae tip adhesin [Candidatus Burkholderia verschuerenii]
MRIAIAFCFGCWGTHHALAQTCSATVSSVDFGQISPATTSATTATGSITVSCTGLLNLPVRACVSLGTGSGGNSYTPRTATSGTNTLQYNLYSDSAATSMWGSQLAGYSPVTVDFPLTALVTAYIVVPIYGRVLPGQSKLVAGTYLSTFSGTTQAQMTYQAYVLSNPPTCSTITGAPSSLSFTVQATVINDCTINASNINFGVSGLLKSAIVSNRTISVACTNNAAYSVALSAGSGSGATVANRTMTRSGGSEQVKYQLYQDSSLTKPWGEGTSGTSAYAGVGSGSTQNIPVYGRVPAQTTSTPGSYIDTVIAMITY